MAAVAPIPSASDRTAMVVMNGEVKSAGNDCFRIRIAVDLLLPHKDTELPISLSTRSDFRSMSICFTGCLSASTADGTQTQEDQ